MDDLDSLAEHLQQEIFTGYGKTAIEYARSPRNVGDIPDADGYASVTGPCGDTMQIWLKVNDRNIEKATFWTDGCGATIVAGSMVTELAKNMDIVAAFNITQKDVLDALQGLPEDSAHCALLAANTLKEAIKNYLACRRDELWKSKYLGNQAD
jgi:nitrogen fixation NifU-like protein